MSILPDPNRYEIEWIKDGSNFKGPLPQFSKLFSCEKNSKWGVRAQVGNILVLQLTNTDIQGQKIATQYTWEDHTKIYQKTLKPLMIIAESLIRQRWKILRTRR